LGFIHFLLPPLAPDYPRPKSEKRLSSSCFVPLQGTRGRRRKEVVVVGSKEVVRSKKRRRQTECNVAAVAAHLDAEEVTEEARKACREAQKARSLARVKEVDNEEAEVLLEPVDVAVGAVQDLEHARVGERRREGGAEGAAQREGVDDEVAAARGELEKAGEALERPASGARRARVLSASRRARALLAGSQTSGRHAGSRGQC
jgi:hypothetical protein